MGLRVNKIRVYEKVHSDINNMKTNTYLDLILKMTGSVFLYSLSLRDEC